MKGLVLTAWSKCIDCGYEGVLEYEHVEDEIYSDEEAMGVMMILRCPACDSHEHTLVPSDYYQELLSDLAVRTEGDESS